MFPESRSVGDTPADELAGVTIVVTTLEDSSEL